MPGFLTLFSFRIPIYQFVKEIHISRLIKSFCLCQTEMNLPLTVGLSPFTRLRYEDFYGEFVKC